MSVFFCLEMVSFWIFVEFFLYVEFILLMGGNCGWCFLRFMRDYVLFNVDLEWKLIYVGFVEDEKYD